MGIFDPGWAIDPNMRTGFEVSLAGATSRSGLRRKKPKWKPDCFDRLAFCIADDGAMTSFQQTCCTKRYPDGTRDTLCFPTCEDADFPEQPGEDTTIWPHI